MNVALFLPSPSASESAADKEANETEKSSYEANACLNRHTTATETKQHSCNANTMRHHVSH